MILLDTCTLLWLVMEQAELSANAISFIKQYPTELHVSAITAFEIAQKYRRGKLELPMFPRDWFAKALLFHGLKEIQLNSNHATRAAGPS